jgi:hypothetical protein
MEGQKMKREPFMYNPKNKLGIIMNEEFIYASTKLTSTQKRLIQSLNLTINYYRERLRNTHPRLTILTNKKDDVAEVWLLND